MAAIAVVSAIGFVISISGSYIKPRLDTNPYIQEYSLPAGSGPNALLVDKNDTVWISSSKPSLFFSFDPVSDKISTYEIHDTAQQKIPGNSTTMVWTMVQDEEGKIWLSQMGTNSVWMFTPKNKEFHWVSLPKGSPFQMKIGNQGEVWFSNINENTVGVIQQDQVLSFSTGKKTNPAGIFLDGNSMWVSEVLLQKIAKYEIKKDTQGIKTISLVDLYPKGNDTWFLSPTDVFVKDNVLWLTEHETSFLTSYDLVNNKVTRYPTSQNFYHAVTLPFWLRPSNQGNGLWFNEHQGSKIGYFDLEKKTLTEYSVLSLPKNGYITYPLNLATNPNDDEIVWFSEWNTDKIGMINHNSKIPFDISVENNTMTLGPNQTKSLSIFINGSNPLTNNVLTLSTSSSIISDASLGNLTVKYSAEKVDLTKTNVIPLYVHNNGVVPGNYTLGLGASDGFVTKIDYIGITIKS